MATPRGAQHRDVEQRIRDLEQRCASLANQVLRQRRLEVTQGDFVVSGGGGIHIGDGGSFSTEYPNGQEGIRFGPITPNPPYEHGLLMFDSAGNPKVWFVEKTDGSFDCAIKGDGINIQSAGSASMLATDAGQTLTLWSPTVDMTWGHVLIGHTTTGSAANCRIEADGRIYRVSSSERYKADIRPLNVDPSAVLAIEGRTWVDKSAVADESPRRQVGFIAEELDAAGLGEFVEYDNQGRPDAIQYDRLTVGLLAVAKAQADQIAALSARLDALEGSA